MKKHLLTKTLLALALVLVSGSVWGEDYELYSGNLTEGDYIVYYNGKAMKNTVSNNRLGYLEVNPTNNVISTTDETIVWHIAKSGDYWTFYNANVQKYAAANGTKNQAQLLESGTDDKSLWTVTKDEGTYDFVNKNNSASNVNSTLRNNGTYGFACYATSTGGALSLYKKVSSNTNTVSTPTFSVPSGTYTTSQSVEISCTTEGTTIYYTTDGADPTTSSSTYSNPISVTVSGTVIKALAVKGTDQSSIASATYTIVPESPVIAIENAVLTITAGSGLTIRYTLNESEPTASSTEYTAPVTLTESCTVKAIAIDTYGNKSAVVTGKFTKIENTSPGSNYFTLVTDASTLAEGDNLIFVYETNAMSTTQNTNNRGAATVTVTTTTETSFIDGISDEVEVLALQGKTDEWYFYATKCSNKGYLYAASSSSNYLRTEEEADDNAKAKITATDNNAFIIAFQGSNSRNLLKYNSGSGIFSCYSTGQNSVKIYKEVAKPQNNKSNANFSFPESIYYVEMGETFTAPVLSKAEGYDGTISYVSSETGVATVDNTGAVTIVGVGTTTITASADETANFYADNASYDLTVYQLQDGKFDFALNYGYGSGLTPKNDNTYVTDESTWTSGNIVMVIAGKYRWWSTDGTLRLFDAGGGNATTLTLSAPSGKIITDIVITGSTLGGVTANTGTYTNGTWTGASKTVVFTWSANLQAKTISATYTDELTISVSSAGYATFYNDYDVTIPAGVKAFYAEADNDGLVMHESADGKIKARYGVVLEAPQGAYTFEATTGATVDDSYNALTGVLEETAQANLIGTYQYVLGMEGTTPMFFELDATGSLGANKAYFATDTKKSAIGMRWEGTTGIANVEAAKESNVYFDLMGRPVEQPTRGIYIMNGKKVFVK